LTTGEERMLTTLAVYLGIDSAAAKAAKALRRNIEVFMLDAVY